MMNKTDNAPENVFNSCKRCQSPLDFRGLCLDDFCAFSRHKQDCQAGWNGYNKNQKSDCSCGFFFAGL